MIVGDWQNKIKKSCSYTMRGARQKKKGNSQLCHSISFSGPIYMVQHAEIKIIIHPTNLPKDGMILDEPIPRNCDSAT